MALFEVVPVVALNVNRHALSEKLLPVASAGCMQNVDFESNTRQPLTKPRQPDGNGENKLIPREKLLLLLRAIGYQGSVNEADPVLKSVFSYNLRRLLTASDVTQAELARALEAKPAQVSRWINGKNLPEGEYVEKIAEFLGVEYDDLYRSIDRKPPPPGTELPLSPAEIANFAKVFERLAQDIRGKTQRVSKPKSDK
jgi:transcriptional regulator with XRE-family HTH domain